MTGETDTEIPDVVLNICFLIADTGAVFTFGNSKIANNVPSRLWLKNDIPVHISCGQSHSAFVTEQGRLFVFGSNNSGQLGLQAKGPVKRPICVKVLKGERVQLVACGTDHTLVSTSQGEIFAAGGNSDGQLGLGHCNGSVSFQRLRPFCDYAPIKLLCAGDHTSAALTEDGRLFLWGDNSVGQLGLGNDSHALLPKELKLGQPVQSASCGYRHSALVTDNGDVFTFGESADGRLGLSAHLLANHSCPQRVESLHRVLQVACGGKHTLALTEDELYSFGRGEFGQLGLGTMMFVADAPVAVGHFRKGRVTHVTCGENHTALITDSGLLYTFGDGRHGKLGLGDENFTNQFSPTVCQRFFDYSVMTVACGSSHMLVFARPRQQESEEVCLEDEDVTYSYLDRCYTSMLQGQPLEHIPDPALVSQLTFLPSSLPTSHRWRLSTRARRRQRKSSSAQFGPEFCNLPPLTTGFTALALTGNILQPRSPTDTPKRFRTDAPVESSSTSITLPVRTLPLTPITKSTEDCHSVGTSENSVSDKTREQHKHKMARASSIGKEENVPQALPTEVQAGSVSHPSMTESPPPSNLKQKKPRSGDPKNAATQEERFYATASQSKMQSKTYKKPIQSTNNKSKGEAVEVRSSPERMSAKEREGCSETCSISIDSRHKVSKAGQGQEVTTLAEMEHETKSKIQNTTSPVHEVKEVRTMPTKVLEVKSHKIKEEGIPVRATKRAKSPVKDQDVPSGSMEVSVVESILQAGPAQKDIKPSLGKAQEVISTLIDTQEQGNPSVKIPAKLQNTPKKGNHVDTEENPGELTPKKAKKKRSDVERAPKKEIAPKTPSSLSVSIPTRMSKAKKGKPVEAENSNVQLRTEMLAQVKRENDSKTPQNSNMSFPPIENRKSGGASEISQSASNLQSEHTNSQSPTDKLLTEQKYEFPSIKSLTPERGHSFSSLWSNNESATSKSSTIKENESPSGNLLSLSPQYRQSPLNEIKLDGKSVEPEEPDRKPQAEQSIMGSVVSPLAAMAIISAAPLLITAAEVFSETSPEQSNTMSLCASMSQEVAGNNFLPEHEVDLGSTVQDVSAQYVQNKLVSDENRKMEKEIDVKDSETERAEERGEEETLAEDEEESEGVGQKKENSVVEDEEERESASAQKGEEDCEVEEGEEEESEAAGEEEDDSNSGQSSKSEGEKSEEGGCEDVTEREEEENEGEDGEMEEENKDEESGGEDEEEERESWDGGSEGEMKTDPEEEQEGENSNDEKTEVGEQSDSEDENKNVRSDEDEGESEENDGREEEENEIEEGEGEQEEKGDEKCEEEDEEGNEDEEENQEEETDHEEEEEGNRDQAKEEEEEENGEEEEGEESAREKEERQNEVEAKDEEKVSEKDGDEERQEGSEQVEEDDGDKEEEMDTSEVKFREEENLDLSETPDVDREDEDDEVDKLNEMMEENNEEEKGSEEETEEEEKETDKKEENTKTDRSGRKQKESTEEEEEHEEESEEEEEEEEEEVEQKEMKIKTEKNRRKLRETSEEEEKQEEESEEDEEEEEAERKEMNIKTEKNRRKQRETSEEEEWEEGDEEEEETEKKDKNMNKDKHENKQRGNTDEEEEQAEEGEEEEEMEEEETKQKEKDIKTEKNRRKQRETSEEEEEHEGESEEEEEEIAEQKEMNIKTEKIGRIQTETTGEEEEEEEEAEEEEEEEAEEEEGEEEEEEESEEEEEKTKKVPKQRDKPNVLPARRQASAQRDRQKTRQRDHQNIKGKKQTGGAQDPQFWNSVLPQYLNLK
ncbi:uncharacterized protein DDB_G0290685 [Rhinichthys klamathensis goyatoka]|uniref:uncharacterized protein DDB_G0290685 n=1 Tax=Rhinichthys klamathensis goyatoka TaxID=3034132 RepID=UPI0024B4B380|nr:uncharacterized protein DDB_G0290685 [Rhinichthys klamathensis goyatoka]